MAQQVNSLPNPNYVVTPLTTVAGSIVSRRRLKVPCNLSGTYSHSKSGLNSVITFDIADNECFVDLSKLVLCIDFFTDFPISVPFPQFDGGVQSLISRITIGSSQGLKIEEINNYNLLSNMIQCITETNIHKESTLSEQSSYTHSTKQIFTDSCAYHDSHGNFPSSHLKSQYFHRLHIRFHQCSFLNKFKMLPLFLFRNGIRIEIELDDLHKSFVYSNAPSLLSLTGFPLNYHFFKLSTAESYYPNFAVHTSLKDGGDFPDATLNLPPNNNLNLSSRLLLHFNIANEIFMKCYGMTWVDKCGLESATHIVPFYIYLQETDNEEQNLKMHGLFAFDQATIAHGFLTKETGYDDVHETWESKTITEIGALEKKGNAYFLLPCMTVFNTVVPIPKIEKTNLSELHTSGKLYIDYDNMIIFAGNEANTSVVHGLNLSRKHLHGNCLARLYPQTSIKDLVGPYSQYSGYKIKNPELLLDVVKPSADEFLKYTQAFQSPSGIPYNYKRIIYKSMQIDSPSANSFIQLPLQLSVRSLTGILFTFQDQIAQFPTSNGYTDFFTYPSLSSFLRCGLVRYEVIVGGQQFPLYPLYIRRTQDGVTNNEVSDSFILELENFFGVNGNAGVIPSISSEAFRDTRNYALCQSHPAGSTPTEIRDSSKSIFIYSCKSICSS